MTILNTVKALLGITDNAQDVLLTIYIDMTVQSILNTTNRHELPPELEFTAAQIAAQTYREASGINVAKGVVSSVSEAGRSVSFDHSQEADVVERQVEERRMQLNRFKLPFKLRG